MKGVLANAALLGEAVVGERPVDGFDHIVALAKLLQGDLRAVGDNPSSRLELSGETVAFQAPDPADRQVAVFADQPSRTFPWAQVDHPLLALLAQEHLVEPGQALGLDLVLQLCLKLKLALVAQFPGDQLACPVADAMGDIVSGDIEDAAVIEHATDDDVAVGMAGVVVVNRDPVEGGREIQFHLAHEVTGEAAKVGHLGAILGRDDEAKLVAISPAALHESPAVGLVLESGIGLAPLAVSGDPVSFEVAEMGIHGPARRRPHLRRPCAPPLRIEPDHPCLDHHPPCPEAARRIPLPPSVAALPRKRDNDLRTSVARVEPARCPSHPAAGRSRSGTYPAGIAACFADRDFDPLQERLRPRIEPRPTAARPSRPDAKILALIPCHDETIDIGTSPYKSCRTSIASNRIKAHDGEEKPGSSSTHIASAIARKIEIKNENSKGGTRAPFAVLKMVPR